MTLAEKRMLTLSLLPTVLYAALAILHVFYFFIVIFIHLFIYYLCWRCLSLTQHIMPGTALSTVWPENTPHTTA